MVSLRPDTTATMSLVLTLSDPSVEVELPGQPPTVVGNFDVLNIPPVSSIDPRP